ncbi:MAG: phage/plasmid primase, P4 family [Chitinophagaceae bacterium]
MSSDGIRIDTGDEAARDHASADVRMGRVIHEGGVPRFTRFQALSKVIGQYVRQARFGWVSIEEAWQAVQGYNAGQISPPWPDARLRQEFVALLKRDRIGNDQDWARHHTTDANDAGAAGAADPTSSISSAADLFGRTHGAIPSPLPPALSDDALAEAFFRRYGLDWRHVPAWGRWLHWTGTHWSQDETNSFREWVRRTCRKFAAMHDKDGEARRVASARTMAAVERILSSDPRLTTRSSDRDAGQMEFNCSGGLIDLGTGEIRGHDRHALITRCSAAQPRNGCSQWSRFIDEITGGEAELAAYLQRVCGYCLSGSTEEQVFFFLHGQGANGKSVFLQVLAAVFGDYAATAALDTFMTSQSDRHSTDLAGLRGARLVVVTETEPGRTWAETRIKTITGGDTIRARFLHRDNFEFRPTFKLIVAGNHRPGLEGLGEAMRRRLHLIPFTVIIPVERRDKHLAEKLLAETDGILGWILEGCAEWQRIGLAPPRVVMAAAADYFADEDQVGQWIAEQCVAGPDFKTAAAALFSSWKAFADGRGQRVGSHKVLGEALRERGFDGCQVGRARGWRGLALRRETGVAHEPASPSTHEAAGAALKTTPTPDLKAQWRDLFDTEPPPFNRRYLESRLAYRIQELAYGGLKPETIRRLERWARNSTAATSRSAASAPIATAPSPAPG